jgi:pimeloyl-ACP methyl ester carboxylesterase
MPKSKVNKKVFSIPKSILITGQTLALVSPVLATDFALKLFRTPYKFPMPKREIKMFEKAQKSRLFIKPLHKEIQLYTCGTGEKKVMLIHGWAGRGTQLNAIAEIFVEKGYQTISFDATAHGKSQGKTSNMNEFITCIHSIDEKYGPFEFAIGHSLGGMALMNAVKNGFQVPKIATVGCGNSINDICQQFVKRLGMKPIIGYKLKNKMDKIFGSDIELLSTYIAAKSVNIPVLVMHDVNDEDVPVENAYNICNNLSNHELFISEGLGHRNILWNKKVLEKMMEFFKI